MISFWGIMDCCRLFKALDHFLKLHLRSGKNFPTCSFLRLWLRLACPLPVLQTSLTDFEFWEANIVYPARTLWMQWSSFFGTSRRTCMKLRYHYPMRSHRASCAVRVFRDFLRRNFPSPGWPHYPEWLWIIGQRLWAMLLGLEHHRSGPNMKFLGSSIAKGSCSTPFQAGAAAGIFNGIWIASNVRSLNALGLWSPWTL